MRFEIQFLFPKFSREQEKAMMEQKLKQMDQPSPPPDPNTKLWNSSSPITRWNSRKANRGMKIQNTTMARVAN